mmetsp:Transcript_53350/g.124932  ORF Transcript_53350/g.124932 Transcript_53350/m.124932 type:complete len:201 (-) Transcript_53350:737-1339(-)
MRIAFIRAHEFTLSSFTRGHHMFIDPRHRLPFIGIKLTAGLGVPACFRHLNITSRAFVRLLSFMPPFSGSAVFPSLLVLCIVVLFLLTLVIIIITITSIFILPITSRRLPIDLDGVCARSPPLTFFLVPTSPIPATSSAEALISSPIIAVPSSTVPLAFAFAFALSITIFPLASFAILAFPLFMLICELNAILLHSFHQL